MHIQINIRYLLLFFIASFLLSSCKSRQTVLSGATFPVKSSGGRTSTILTDASNARGMALEGKSLDNYAQLMEVKTKDLNPKLYDFVDYWMGTPHQLGGLTKRGVDCSAFVGMLYKDVYRAELPRSSRDMGEQVKRKYERQLQEGDLIFFSFGGKNIDHVGVYLHNNKFVHVSTKRGVIISDLKDTWYYRYFTRAGSFKNF